MCLCSLIHFAVYFHSFSSIHSLSAISSMGGIVDLLAEMLQAVNPGDRSVCSLVVSLASNLVHIAICQ